MAEPIKIPALPPLSNTQFSLATLFPVEHPTAGTAKMTAEQLRNFYQPVAALPAHASLNDSHAGLIVAWKDGSAQVATVSGGVPAAAGVWEIEAKNPVFTKPTLAEHRLKLTSNPSSSEWFTWFGDTFTFVSGTPANIKEIQIGADNVETAANTAASLTAWGGPDYYTATHLGDNQVAVYAGPSYAGTYGNNPIFSTNVPGLSQTLQVSAQNNDLGNVNTVVVTWQKNNGPTNQVTVGDLCAPGAPYGELLADYKWPADNIEAAANLKWALDQKVEFYSDFVASYTSGTAVVQINEITPPVGESSNIVSASIYNYPVMIMEYSEVEKPPYVRDLVLGALLYVHDGKAYFSPSVMFRAKLSADSSPIVFDTNSAKPSPRILQYTDAGCVKGGFDFDYNQETYYGNGFLLAMEQGTAGQTILVQRVFFIGG